LSAQGEFRPDGKTAVITGAGSGIGRAIALKFAANGAAMRILDLNLNDAEAVTKEITTAGGSASAHSMAAAVFGRSSCSARTNHFQGFRGVPIFGVKRERFA
jgi:NAD(P)-dependent dehydrogenase (short-subunit alcohol dehydrogenase family)